MEHISESAAIVRQIARVKLMTALARIPKSRFDMLKKVVWGAGVSGKSFVQMNDFLDLAYLVDGRERLQGTAFEGLKIQPPSVLLGEDRDNVCVFLPTVIAAELHEILSSEGFRYIIIPNHINTSGLQIPVPRSDIKLVFSAFAQEKVDYAVLRWANEPLQSLADIDLMTESSKDNLSRLMRACTGWISRSGCNDHDTITVDIKFSAPVGLTNELPYFPLPLTQALFSEGGTQYKRGLRVPSDELSVFTYLYHILFQKAEKSGLPVGLSNTGSGETGSGATSGFVSEACIASDTSSASAEGNKYMRIISALREKTGIEIPRNLEGIWCWLRDSAFPPPMDYARKWASETGGGLLPKLTRHRVLETNNICVFIFREWFSSRPEALGACVARLEKSGFREAALTILSKPEQRKVALHIRGGVWGETHSSIIGGKPYAVGVFKHDAGVDIQRAKENLREYCGAVAGREVNAIHSSDDHMEGLEYRDIINRCISERP